MTASLADKAYKALKKDIIQCSLEPGQQIVQSQLSETYGIGATPLREALQRLAQEGFVRAVPRFGYIVIPVTLRDVREIFELRAVIESAAARLAAERGSDRELEKLEANAKFSYVYGDKESYSHFLSQNVEFHRSVAVAAGNRRMVDVLSALLEEMTRIFHLGLDLRDSAAEMREEHIELTDALSDRDPDRAEQIVRDQIDASQQRILEALTRRRGLGSGDGLQVDLSPSGAERGAG
jgi:DNA-binding GntR family transcriptional regulator